MWCNFTFVRVKLTNFKNDYDDDDDDEPDKFKKLDPRRAELAVKNQNEVYTANIENYHELQFE